MEVGGRKLGGVRLQEFARYYGKGVGFRRLLVPWDFGGKETFQEFPSTIISGVRCGGFVGCSVFVRLYLYGVKVVPVLVFPYQGFVFLFWRRCGVGFWPYILSKATKNLTIMISRLNKVNYVWLAGGELSSLTTVYFQLLWFDLIYSLIYLLCPHTYSATIFTNVFRFIGSERADILSI